MADYLIRLVSTSNPNGATGIDWPPYTEGAPHLLDFLDGNVSLKIGEDTFRREATEFVTELSLAHSR
ncbi:hypothetical protein A0H81_14552 [Grifola frondosa]|uniref:Uncharacterized protein n=1 Tax=Grifola frondosa TaxID=5627 RepID=A0A1C7LMP9_GRIFR|nr:hypothetical protein A0H81_14552 [Grifola frondosa]